MAAIAVDQSRVLQGTSGDPGGGPYITLRLTEESGRILKVDFDTNGCPAAQAAACGLAAFAKGRTLEQLSRLETADLILMIGGLPDGKGHYAQMAVEAVQKALGT